MKKHWLEKIITVTPAEVEKAVRELIKIGIQENTKAEWLILNWADTQIIHVGLNTYPQTFDFQVPISSS